MPPVEEAVSIFMKLALHALSEAERRIPRGPGELAKASTCLKEAEELFMVGPLPTTRQSAEAYSKVREAQKLVDKVFPNGEVKVVKEATRVIRECLTLH